MLVNPCKRTGTQKRTRQTRTAVGSKTRLAWPVAFVGRFASRWCRCHPRPKHGPPRVLPARYQATLGTATPPGRRPTHRPLDQRTPGGARAGRGGGGNATHTVIDHTPCCYGHETREERKGDRARQQQQQQQQGHTFAGSLGSKLGWSCMAWSRSKMVTFSSPNLLATRVSGAAHDVSTVGFCCCVPRAASTESAGRHETRRHTHHVRTFCAEQTFCLHLEPHS